MGDDGVVPPPRLRAVLDERGLREIARVGGGEYFEIGREADSDMAFRLISSVRQRASLRDETTSYEDLYWHFMVATASLLGFAALLLRKQAELWWQTVGVAAALGILVAVVG
jgi:hypothetical protein